MASGKTSSSHFCSSQTCRGTGAVTVAAGPPPRRPRAPHPRSHPGGGCRARGGSGVGVGRSSRCLAPSPACPQCPPTPKLKGKVPGRLARWGREWARLAACAARGRPAPGTPARVGVPGPAWPGLIPNGVRGRGAAGRAAGLGSALTAPARHKGGVPGRRGAFPQTSSFQKIFKNIKKITGYIKNP